MRYGIFGGAFDPPHSEHFRLVDELKNRLLLEKVIIVPSYNPPHKDKGLANFDRRIGLLKLFIKDRPYIVISEAEKELGLTESYAYEIIPEIIKRYGEAEYFYLMGGDSLVNFFDWKHPERIAGVIPIAVCARKGFVGLEEAAEKVRNELGGDVRLFPDVNLSEISSGELKVRLALSFDVSDYLPTTARAFIKENGLYCEFDKLIDKVKTYESESLFNHSARTAVFAVRYATKAGVSYKKAFIAALLHDCGKSGAPQRPVSEYNASFEVIHQYDGRTLAESVFGITDEEILDAIEYHTTGKPDMSNLAKLIYAADKLEEGRCYEGVSFLREEFCKDFDSGFIRLINRNMAYLMQKGIEPDPLTIKCAAYYNK